MADLQDLKQKKYPIIIDDREYFLHYDYSAYMELAEKCGINSLEELKNKVLSNNLSVRQEIELIKCGLIRHHADVDEKIILKIDNMAEIAKIVLMAFSQPLYLPEIFNEIFFPDEDESEEKKTKNQTETNGQEIQQ